MYELKNTKMCINDHTDPVKVDRVTFTANNMSFILFSKWFSDKSGKGLVYSSDLDSVKISGSWNNSTYDEILNSIARRHNMDLISLENTYYVGVLKPEDRATFVKQVWGYSSEEIKNIATIMLSEQGKCFVTTDNLLTVSDKTSVIMRINNIIDTINNMPKHTWICQLYLVYFRKDQVLEYGAKVTPSADIAYNLTNDTSVTTGLDYDAQVSALMSADFNSQFTKLYASPMLLVRNGQEAKWSDGQDVPIPLYQTSQYGVQTVTGYDYKQTGLDIQIKVIESTRESAILDLTLVNNMVSGYVEEAPILTGTTLTSTTNIKSGGVYLLSEINAVQITDELSNFAFFSNGDEEIKFQVWAKVYKIKGFTNQTIEEKI